jgi:ribonuclease PH
MATEPISPLRADGRRADEIRPLTFDVDFITSATGSVLVTAGATRVICTAMVEESVPGWMRNQGTGWITAEYGMLPGSTNSRKPRDAARGRLDGRTVEIQRLIGRSLRAVVDRSRLGERTVWVDCDVIQADGGTRCAAISGGYVAVHRALARLVADGRLEQLPLSDTVSAVSVGVIDGAPLLDLPYEEDVRAETDMNVVMTGDGRFVEVQGTAEGAPFGREDLDGLLALAEHGIGEIRALQLQACTRP